LRNKLLLIGAGGHCRSIIDSLDTSIYTDIAILDEALSVGKKVNSIPVIGTDADATALFEAGYNNAIIALGSIGNPAMRIKLYQKYKSIRFNFPAIIDSTAIISKIAIISEGVFIGKGAIVNTGAQLGACCIINTGAIIDHDCTIGDFAHISPAARLSGGVRIGNNSHIGVGSTIVQSINIGNNTIIGAGSVVTKDIPNNVVAIGIPCKPIKPNEVSE